MAADTTCGTFIASVLLALKFSAGIAIKNAFRSGKSVGFPIFLDNRSFAHKCSSFMVFIKCREQIISANAYGSQGCKFIHFLLINTSYNLNLSILLF